MAIAQLRYDGEGGWTLYFGDRYSGPTMYYDLEPSVDIKTILDELDEDPACVFWG